MFIICLIFGVILGNILLRLPQFLLFDSFENKKRSITREIDRLNDRHKSALREFSELNDLIISAEIIYNDHKQEWFMSENFKDLLYHVVSFDYTSFIFGVCDLEYDKKGIPLKSSIINKEWCLLLSQLDGDKFRELIMYYRGMNIDVFIKLDELKKELSLIHEQRYQNQIILDQLNNCNLMDRIFRRFPK